MVSASVGFQCPECVAEGRASAPVLTSPLGTRVPSRPYVSYALIGICLVVFAFQTLLGNEFDARWEMWPNGVAAFDQYYRLLTATFMHGGLLHIGFNMYVLWVLGPSLENLLGHVRFATLYLLAGLGGSVASFWFSDPRVPSLGASGAIFGLMGAYVVVGKALRADITQVLVLIGINVAIGFVASGIDWRAHLGGLVTGALVAAVFVHAPARNRVLVQVVACVAIVLLLAGLTVARDNAITTTLIEQGYDLTPIA
jgi:membrane associated rhomboid family serine protease